MNSRSLQKMKAALDDGRGDASEEKEAARTEVLEMTGKHVWRLLESDLFPRFKKSDLYLRFLAAAATKEQVTAWANDLDILLRDQVTR